MNKHRWLCPRVFLWALYGAVIAWAGAAAAACPGPLAVQVLGSGGPIADSDRASSGYLLWVEGKARLLVDAGGGTLVRLGRSGADFSDLSALLLTHFHTDHAAELPAILMSAWFGARSRPLPISGPSGADDFPGLNRFLRALFAPGGAFAYLGDFMSGDGTFALQPVEVDVGPLKPRVVFRDKQMTVSALPVPHGRVPALAYRVDIGGQSIVFSGDQNGSRDEFIAFARKANLMILPFAIPDDADPVARRLHATPTRLGEMAAQSGVRQVLLSHIMQRAWIKRKQGLASIYQHYRGALTWAQDMGCYPVVPNKGTVSRE